MLFEFKKIVKKGYVLLSLVVAMILSLVAVLSASYNVHNHINPNPDSLDNYTMNFSMIVVTNYVRNIEDGPMTEDSEGMLLLDEVTISVKNPAGNYRNDPYYEENSSEFSYSPVTTEFLDAFEEACRLDDITLDESVKEDLRYTRVAFPHYEEKLASNPNYKYTGASTTLLEKAGIIFGLVPIIVFSLAASSLETEEFETGTEAFYRVLPEKRSKSLFNRLLAVLLYSLIYVLFVIFFVCVFSVIKGDGLGDFLYPHRVADSNILSQAVWKLLSQIILVFLAKVLLVTVFTLFISSMVRSNTVVSLFIIISGILMFLLTEYEPSLHNNWNIFYFPYRMQVYGRRVDLQYVGGEVGESVMEQDPISNTLWLVWGLLSVAFYMLSSYFHVRNRSTKQVDKVVGSKRKFFLNFESLKLKYAVPNWLVYGSVLSFIFVLAVAMYRNDFDSKSVYSKDYETKRIEAIIESFKEGIEEAEKEALKHPEVSYEDIIKHYNTYIDYYRDKKELLITRKEAYLTGDSTTYYNSLKKDIDELFGVGIEVLSVEEYKPKLQYYKNGQAFPSGYSRSLSHYRLDELIKREIRPIANAAAVETPYDETIRYEDRVKDRLNAQVADSSFLGIWYRLIDLYNFDIVFLCLVLLFCGRFYIMERERGHSLALLYTLPNKRSKIHRDKFTASLIKLIQILIFTVLVVIVAGYLQDGFGQAKFPVIHYNFIVEDPEAFRSFAPSFHFDDLGRYVVESIALLFLVAVFILSLSLLVSTYVKSFNAVFATVMVILVAGYSLMYLPFMKGISQYLPFTYLRIAQVIDGSTIFNITNKPLSVISGGIVLVIWSVVCYVISQRRLKKLMLDA